MLMQQMIFGRITVFVHGGEPDLERSWRILQTVKLPYGKHDSWPEANKTDFVLCKEQTSLFENLAEVADGTRVTVEVKHGLPFLIEIEQDHRAA